MIIQYFSGDKNLWVISWKKKSKQHLEGEAGETHKSHLQNSRSVKVGNVYFECKIQSKKD